MTGRALGYIAAAVCAGAGIYLLRYHGTAVATIGGSSGRSWFEILGHGIGIYFIGKGLFIARSTQLEADQADRLKQLVELQALAHSGEHHPKR